ncbi:flagellar hook protein FlgE [Asticcacaulis excentricus]|uniref:Flagellar hook protein FlgE n=1 Tax=Asticcacaulis excentricus (strain ATCC 15261 / DSM 4724 / KCTC 12464 / NCIMB 9791 / VKM B-1370 / CB 48) TaxID=573065 RepID=E8RPA0_ASTEC|nr:flagellar hook protein FlgE [Asticcacaulis excentricus]ADU11946.1 fagellar hook-basal body protein [Asticcacaulis excentricus CB 48]
MSISSAMLSGVSALSANSTALAAISNNIANVNTTAYKSVSTSFAANVSSSGSSTYSSGGVSASTALSITEAGALQTTTSSLDLAIDGSGFFVVSEGADGSGGSYYTRDGSFSVNDEGYLVNSSGYYLQGWQADSSGNVTAASSVSDLSAIKIPTSSDTPTATTSISLAANLNSATEAYAGEYDISTGLSMANYDEDEETGVEPDFEIGISVSDSLGKEHTLTLSVLKSETTNEWTAELWSDDVTGGYGSEGNIIKSGTITFNEDGTLNEDSLAAFFGAEDLSQIKIDIAASSDETGALRWTSETGAAAQSLSLSFDDTQGGLTQYATTSEVKSIKADGTVFSDLSDVTIADDGTVNAIYEDGTSRVLAQIPVATFVNANGLTAKSGNVYALSSESGSYTLRTPGSGGAGLLASSSLEASTVDLSSEFTSLITIQRAYSAASKIITTSDEMMQTVIESKR